MSFAPRSAKKKSNPPTRGGNPSRCAICDSTMHWARDCPHSEKEDQKQVEIPSLVAGTTNKHMCSFVRESFNSAILDSGCTSNVCGQSWLECYINGLDADEKKCIIETRSDTNFKFGDGDVAVSKRKVTIPAKIGSTQVTITTDVIQKDLPLLFSKDAMKAAKTVLCFGSDSVEMFGQSIPLQFTSTGHYMIKLRDPKKQDEKKTIS